MNLAKTTRLALLSLSRNRLRSFLMMLGVTVGIASLTALASVGEATKQETIRARKDVELKEIHAKSELFMMYLERSFDERQKNFADLFAALDTAMQSGGDVAMILGAITTLAASSPFKDLHDIDLVRKNLADPDHEWTV